MPLLEVIPGYVFAQDEAVTYAKLNALGQPVVNLTTELFNLLSSFKNGFINGNFQVWQRGTTAKTCAAAAKTWRADRWFCRPTGATCSYERSTTLPPAAVAAYSAKLIGAAAVTTVDFGQRIEAIDAYSGWLRQRTFSAWIYNDTGAVFTPKLRINTPSVADTYTSNTNRLDQALQACPSGAWTQVSTTIDGASYVNAANGIEMVIQIPDGALNSAGKVVYITQIQCEPGPTVTAQEPRLITHELLLCQRYAFALSNQVVGFAENANNLYNKGIMTYPTTMRAKPVFDGNNTSTGDNVNDFFTATSGAAGTPVISGYAGNTIFACANSGTGWTATAQINLTCVLTAEDLS
jgi:hypothetical protein